MMTDVLSIILICLFFFFAAKPEKVGQYIYEVQAAYQQAQDKE